MIANKRDVSTLVDLIQTYEGVKEKGTTFIFEEDIEEFLSYGELYEQARKLLYHLQKKGLKAKDEAVFQIMNIKSFIVSFWACVLGGIVPVPVSIENNEEHKIKLQKIMDLLSNPYIIADETGSKVIEDHIIKYPEELQLSSLVDKIIRVDELQDLYEDNGRIFESSSEDIAMIQFSSGSTGNPKGVLLSHKNILANSQALASRLNWTNKDKLLNWITLTHNMGMIACYLTSVLVGMNQYHMPTSLFIANPVLWFQKINTYRIDAVMSPNFGIKHFLMNFQDKMANDWDLSCLRMIVTGAEPTNVSMCQEFLKRMKPYKLNSRVIVSGYGLAEYTVAACVSKPLEPMGVVRLNSSSLSVGEKVKYASEGDSRYIELLDVGYPIGDTQVRIVDSNNNILQEDYYGYIQLKGRSVTSGYYNNEKDSSNLFTEDGWLNTGDLGFLRKQKLVIMGRSKEVIIINGHNLYPYDIERVAEKLELVGEGNIAVCGVNKQGKNREEILGCVQYEGIIEDFVPVYEQLKKYINEKMGVVLDYILPIKKIPKTSSGKIKRVQLSKDFESGEMDAVKTKLDSLLSSRKNCNGVGDLTQTEIELKRVCGKFFNAYDIGVDDNFLNYGISSIVITQLTQYLNEIFNKKIKTSDFFAYCTIRKLAEYIDQDEDNEFIESRYKTDFISIEKEAVKTLAREIDVLKETIVIGVYCYTLKYILKESVIPLIVQTKQDESKSLIVDTEAFSKMDDFFHNIQEQVKNIGSVGPQFNENASVKDMDIYLDNKDRYKELDLRLTIEEEADLVKLSFCYDSLKVRINTIKELIFNYEKLLNKMIAK